MHTVHVVLLRLEMEPGPLPPQHGVGPREPVGGVSGDARRETEHGEVHEAGPGPCQEGVRDDERHRDRGGQDGGARAAATPVGVRVQKRRGGA